MKRFMLLSLLFAGISGILCAGQQKEGPAKESSITRLTGCLEATPGGGYFLRNGSGRAVEIAGKASKLSRYVNHQVTLSGEYEINDVETGTTQGESGDRYFRLERIEHVGELCR